MFTIKVFYTGAGPIISYDKIVTEEEFNGEKLVDLRDYIRLEYRVNNVIHRDNKPAVFQVNGFTFFEKSYYNNGTIIKTHIEPILPLAGVNTSSYTIHYNENCRKENDTINCNQFSPVKNIPVKGIYTVVFQDNKIVEDKFEPMEDWKLNAKNRFDSLLKERNNAEQNAKKARNDFEQLERQYQKMKEELLSHKILSLNDLPYEKKE